MKRSCVFLLFLSLWCPRPLLAQLKAFGGRQNDHNCKEIFLVNPSDSIFYIAGLHQNDLGNCRTFGGKKRTQSPVFRINVSDNEDNYLLLLPKDTIVYNVLIPSEIAQQEKQLSVMVRCSATVIDINNDKKRNRKISRLEGRRLYLNIIEK